MPLGGLLGVDERGSALGSINPLSPSLLGAVPTINRVYFRIDNFVFSHKQEALNQELYLTQATASRAVLALSAHQRRGETVFIGPYHLSTAGRDRVYRAIPPLYGGARPGL